ncbi:hypothetical protein [Methylobacterium sp. GXF4]|uniref:hypothetical protein n=1 Tax=Methylobacterium sp. GXF4 TaxID=1096546 RepID=UPI000FFE54C0|nr:hypothetical protein [Methylobacterium sp. GXF4]
MRLRYLERVAISEYVAQVLEEALELHIKRLKQAMNDERDRADRIAWSRARYRCDALRDVCSNIARERLVMGPIAPETLADIAHHIELRSYEMPRSAANAESLKAQRAARRVAEEARKAALKEERERRRGA